MSDIDLSAAIEAAREAKGARSVRAMVTAAAPLTEAAVREQIARDIEDAGRAEVAALSKYLDDDLDRGRVVGVEDAYRDAIRIARGDLP